MKKLRLFPLIIFALFTAYLITSCSKDDNNDNTGAYTNGCFIANEGNFGNANAEVSFYSYSSDSIANGIFKKVNNRELGDVLNSMAIYKNKIYMILNNSHKVEIATIDDFKQAGTIMEVKSPRYIGFFDNNAYITLWGDDPTDTGYLAIADLETLKVTKTIKTGIGPEGVLVKDNKIWVANGGGYTVDSTVTVFSVSDNSLVKTIVVGYCPKNFVVDKDNMIWVLCVGASDYADGSNDKPSSFAIINPTDYSVKKITIGKNDHPMQIGISKDKKTIFYGAGYSFSGIYKIAYNAQDFSKTKLIEGFFYGFSVNPNNDEIYTFDAKDYKSAGSMVRYKSDGTKIKEYTTGLIPSMAVFQ